MFDRFGLESGRAFFELFFWMFDQIDATKVDTRAITCPVLCVEGADDKWVSEPAGSTGRRRGSSSKLALDVLNDEIARGNGTIPPPSERIPADTLCLKRAVWQHVYELRSVHENPEAAVRAFQRAAKKLIEDRKIVAKFGPWVWPVRFSVR